MKLKGLKKAVGEYQRANAEGYYSPRYGKLMLDRETGELQTDEFYSLGHNSWNEYHSESIINLGAVLAEHGESVNMKNARAFAEKEIDKYINKAKKHAENEY